MKPARFHCSCWTGNEFIAPKDLDIVDEGNHGVIIKVMQRKMLKDFLGNVWKSDKFNLGVARFRAPGPLSPSGLTMECIAGAIGGAKIADFGQEPILDGVVSNDDDPFREHCRSSVFRVRPRIKYEGQWISVVTNLRAIAGFMTVIEAGVP